MKDLLAAQRYAQALFELARDERADVSCGEELDAFAAAVCGTPEIERFFANPSVRTSDKQSFLRKLAARDGDSAPARALVLNLLAVLLDKNRFGLLADINRSYRTIAVRERREALAEIRTAVPLDEPSLRRIVEKLQARQGLKIVATTQVDPSLIGGVHVRIGHRVIDGSVRGRLAGLRAGLKQANVI